MGLYEACEAGDLITVRHLTMDFWYNSVNSVVGSGRKPLLGSGIINVYFIIYR